MKRFNLLQIMRKAHQFYKNNRSKYMTFTDALRRNWKNAKFNSWLEEQRPVMEAENLGRWVTLQTDAPTDIYWLGRKYEHAINH